MDNSFSIHTIVVLLPPIIAGIIGLITSGSGISGRIKKINYYLKRLELISNLSDYIDNHELKGGKERYRETINFEISEIFTFIQKTKTDKSEVKVILERQQSGRFKKLFILPKPITAGGWFATIIYYLYAFIIVMYLTLLIYPFDNTPLNIILWNIIFGVIFFSLSRYFALKTWRKKSKQLIDTMNNI